MQGLTHKILLVLLALTIVGEVASISFWVLNPVLFFGPARDSLAVDWTVAVANGAVWVTLNVVALALTLKRKRIGPLMVVVVAVLNRAFSLPVFGQGINELIAGTVLLVIFGAVDFWRLSKQK